MTGVKRFADTRNRQHRKKTLEYIDDSIYVLYESFLNSDAKNILNGSN